MAFLLASAATFEPPGLILTVGDARRQRLRLEVGRASAHAAFAHWLARERRG